MALVFTVEFAKRNRLKILKILRFLYICVNELIP